MNLKITGTISPDVTIPDSGPPNGTWNGRDYWTWYAAEETWYLFWFTVKSTKWVISADLGTLSLSLGVWYGPNAVSPVGTYTPVAPATGDATVAEYVPDNTPDAFVFTDVVDADLSTQIVSDSQVITGMDAGTTISVTGGEYRLDGGAWTAGAGTINPGQTLELRGTSSVDPLTETDVSVTVGTVTVDWSLTTRALAAGCEVIYQQAHLLINGPCSVRTW